MAIDELEKKIIGYISSHRLCTIALSRGNEPSAHTVYYINDGLTIYFEADPITDKIKTIQVNPKIALTIDEDYDDFGKIKGIQLVGRAEIVPKDHEGELRHNHADKFPSAKEYGGVPDHHVWIRVAPEKIYFLDYEKEFGYRTILHVEEKQSRIKWGG
ncbi:MAG: pyridoxamine 5'-phosphate oxidase family protein [Methanobacteriota archaeon]